jgi:hypothetical protein
MYRVVALILLLLPFTVNADKSCPKNIQDFLIDFQSNHEFQVAHTNYPLTYSYVDTSADPEPKKIKVSILSANEVKSKKPPSYPMPNAIQSIPLKQTITNATTTGNFIVNFTKPDTDYSFEYIFLNKYNCWQLSEINDFSL